MFDQQVAHILNAVPSNRVSELCQNGGAFLKNLPKDTKLLWHRVINAQGKLSFPCASNAYQIQKARLEKEGVVFDKGRISLKLFGWNQ